jgi:hypothetical protein
MRGTAAYSLCQFQHVFRRQLLDHFVCFAILYPNNRPMSSAIDGEHDLVLAEKSAIVDRFGGLDQLPALRRLRRRNVRRLRKRRDFRVGRRYYHLKPLPNATDAFILCLSVMNGET